MNIAAEDHNVICSIAGRYSGRNVDKISILKESGIASFYDAKQIKAPMLQGAAMNAECKLIKQEDQLGDHIMFVGEVIHISADENKRPLVYHNGRYWMLGETIVKPPAEIFNRIEELAMRYPRSGAT